jgi:hypothetical protein
MRGKILARESLRSELILLWSMGVSTPQCYLIAALANNSLIAAAEIVLNLDWRYRGAHDPSDKRVPPDRNSPAGIPGRLLGIGALRP